MGVSVKVQFQQAVVILPKIVYDYTSTLILHLIELHNIKKKKN